MATKKTEAKTKTVSPAQEQQNVFSGSYFAGVGRRKAAVAQVRLYPTKEEQENGITVINGRSLERYFPVVTQQNSFLSPLRAVSLIGRFNVSVLVRGGGMTGQVEAARLGIARSLVRFNEELKKTLRDNGLLTRDARKVERKKPGLKKARRAPQWAKR